MSCIGLDPLWKVSMTNASLLPPGLYMAYFTEFLLCQALNSARIRNPSGGETQIVGICVTPNSENSARVFSTLI